MLTPILYPWRRQWHPTPVCLPGKSHEQRSLVGCNPWGGEESDTTERLHFRFSLSGIGEGNGNPLQCSCLENPRDGGAWWAAICGVSQSRTWLKRLSSSSSSNTGPVLSADSMGTDYQVTQETAWVKLRDQEEFYLVDIYLFGLTSDQAQWFKSLLFRIWKESAAGYDQPSYTGQDFPEEKKIAPFKLLAF